MACTPEILENLATSDTFYRWLNGQRAIADPLLAAGTNSPALTAIQTTLQAHTNCLTSQNRSVTNVNSDNSLKRTKITELTASINERQLDVQISQDRALLVRHPEMSRSYYESILPIGRPVAHYTVPILIGISTFLLSLSFFMLLNIMSVDARLLVPMSSSSSIRGSYATPFWMMSGVAVILLGLTIYAFTR